MGRVNQPVRGVAAAKQRAMALAARVPSTKCTVVEIGTMTGNMAIEFKKLRPSATLICVDSWLGREDQPARYIRTRDDNALKSTEMAKKHKQEAYRRFGLNGISVLNMTSLEAAHLFAERSLDLVFIDADHSYDAVVEDIAAWEPKVSLNGWIGGHDYRNIDPRFGGVDQAVQEAFQDREIHEDFNYTWWVRI